MTDPNRNACRVGLALTFFVAGHATRFFRTKSKILLQVKILYIWIFIYFIYSYLWRIIIVNIYTYIIICVLDSDAYKKKIRQWNKKIITFPLFFLPLFYFLIKNSNDFFVNLNLHVVTLLQFLNGNHLFEHEVHSPWCTQIQWCTICYTFVRLKQQTYKCFFKQLYMFRMLIRWNCQKKINFKKLN